MSMPATQMNSANPTLPLSNNMLLGVVKIPVPIIRLKMLGVHQYYSFNEGEVNLQEDRANQANLASGIAGLVDGVPILEATLFRLSIAGRRCVDGISSIFALQAGGHDGDGGGNSTSQKLASKHVL